MSRIQTSCLSLTPTHSPASSVSAILLESGASFFPTPSALEFRRLTLKRFPFELPSMLPPASPDYQSEQVVPHSKAPSVAPLALKRAATLLHVGPKPCTTSLPDPTPPEAVRRAHSAAHPDGPVQIRQKCPPPHLQATAAPSSLNVRRARQMKGRMWGIPPKEPSNSLALVILKDQPDWAVRRMDGTHR